MSNPKENPNAFKNWINSQVAEKYFGSDPGAKTHLTRIKSQLPTLELRGRVRLISNELWNYFDKPYPIALKRLMKVTRKQNLKSFELWPATEFIQIYGLDYLNESMEAMIELTPKFTAEFSIRPFLNRYGIEVYERLDDLIESPDEHIRRWVSEGTRPRLPWGERLPAAIADPSRGLRMLESLRFDSSLYVRKSVANHLNDIAKDHPQMVIETLNRWSKSVPKTYSNEFEFLRHRALRTLIKEGNPAALKLMGIQPSNSSLKLSRFVLSTKSLRVGNSLEFTYVLENKTRKPVPYILDYVVYYKKANGALAAKVFKLRKGQLAAHKRFNGKKRHSFRPVTTRVLYPGKHLISLKLNGEETKSLEFVLKA